MFNICCSATSDPWVRLIVHFLPKIFCIVSFLFHQDFTEVQGDLNDNGCVYVIIIILRLVVGGPPLHPPPPRGLKKSLGCGTLYI